MATHKKVNKHFYAISTGGSSQIVTSWQECEAIRKASPYKSVYKGFMYKEEAILFLKTLAPDIPIAVSNFQIDSIDNDKIAAAYVTGVFNHDLEIYGYGAILCPINHPSENICFSDSDGDAVIYKPVIGEINGAMRVINEAAGRGFQWLIIYHHYIATREWATGQWEGNLGFTRKYAAFCNRMRQRIHILFLEAPKDEKGLEKDGLAASLAAKAALLYSSTSAAISKN